MGTDIHLHVEVFQNGAWVYDPTIVYETRNYDVFAMLANVRNGIGFGGCDTGDGFTPIDLPRGLPSDMSPEVTTAAAEWGDGGHSHSHLLLSELEDYTWAATATQRGVVDAKEFFRMRHAGTAKPRNYCAAVAGPNVLMVSTTEMEDILTGKVRRWRTPAGDPPQWAPPDLYAQMEWTETYASCAERFFAEFLPDLQHLAEERNLCHDDVRIVFWFDS